MDWKQIPSNPRYWVSSTGLVRKAVNATHPERSQWWYREGYREPRGYISVMIDRQRWLIHRLVYSVFVGPLVEGLVVCHRDGNPSNNSVDNLIQDTQKVNISHKTMHGTAQVGEKNARSRYNLETVKTVSNALAQASRYPSGMLRHGEATKIANEFGVSVELVHSLRKGGWSAAMGAARDVILLRS